MNIEDFKKIYPDFDSGDVNIKFITNLETNTISVFKNGLHVDTTTQEKINSEYMQWLNKLKIITAIDLIAETEQDERRLNDLQL